MAGTAYEIEVKSLLGSATAAAGLRHKLEELDSSCACLSTHTQLNHYFEGGDLQKLVDTIAPKLADEDADKMREVITIGKDISVRTRAADGKTRIVLKASIGSDTSANGVARLELDAHVPDTSIDALDALVLASGFRYQAKWSRTREEYQLGPIAICLDKNAGYGYVAEFEMVVEDESSAAPARTQIDALMQQLGVAELSQERLERMFTYYNSHWPEYYGTENIFTIE